MTTAAVSHQKVLIVDFGSQVTQLIARRLREANVYCEIHPFAKAETALTAMKPQAIILSGGPASVHEAGSPRAPQAVFEAGVPVLGICYGEMTLCEQLGGKVEGGHTREFGRAGITVSKSSPLLAGLAGVGEDETVWMSHGDKIVAIPEGFEVVATSAGSPYAVIADETRRFYGVQFHPEVMHTPRGATILKNFTHGIAGLTGDWTMAAYRDEQVAKIRAQVGSAKVICGLSGGVDSMLLLTLADQLKSTMHLELTAIHVHHGLSPNADAWAAFCTDVCDAKEIPLTITRVQIDRRSPSGVEGAARAARYAAFAEEGFPYVLLAQHADD